MNALTAGRFGEFFRALYGENVLPFPWQSRVVARVAEASEDAAGWPQALALPTASGKTSCLDIAVFALACQAKLPPVQRSAPRRIFFVVDRRVIVDEAFSRAEHLANSLRQARSGILAEVAEALRSLTGDPKADPLICFQLRGGVYRDDAWARTPMQPTIIASTVDQIGSRLLFRGYGVSPGMYPIHAGLAGNDALVILDEAHCAQSFMETLLAIERYRGFGKEPLTTPFRVVLMSATPPPDLADIEKADNEDRRDNVLGKRLRAPKPTTLVEAVRATGKKAIEELSQQLAERALQIAGHNAPVAVAVMVNRIATARRVHELLSNQNKYDVVLLTGRMRPIDREQITQDWLTRLNAAQEGDRTLTRSVFVVATQCLEVGANLDFDALVTECASLDALRQRFGRLNRRGRDINAPGVIVIRTDQTTSKEKPVEQDPIYRNALPNTWVWLKSQATSDQINFGVDALDALIETNFGNDPAALRRLLAPQPSAPVMLPSHVDCWVQTSPEPVPNPDIAIFLHGPERGVADVHVCWRADLPIDHVDEESWIDTVSLCPPSASEMMPVPFPVFLGWFIGKDFGDTATGDVEGDPVTEEIPDGEPEPVHAALRWLGPQHSTVITRASELRPGDTIVLPAQAGGWELFGHVPSGRGTPNHIDAGDQANLVARATPTLRLHAALVAAWPNCPSQQRFIELISPETLATRLSEPEFVAELRDALFGLSEEQTSPKWLRDTAQALARLGGRLASHLTPYPGPVMAGVVLHSPKRLPEYTKLGQSSFTDEDDSSSTGEPRGLQAHCEDVASQLERFASVGSLPASVTADAILAASLHDVGKADPRFQALLRGGDRRAVGDLFAKSERLPASRSAYLAAQERSGYPVGSRHELLSLRLIESTPALFNGVTDPELFLHLVASHHGYCRPFAPIVHDEKPLVVNLPWNGSRLTASTQTEQERLDSGVAERFWRLVRRYGWWGLAYLEALFRLADHRASQSPPTE